MGEIRQSELLTLSTLRMGVETGRAWGRGCDPAKAYRRLSELLNATATEVGH